MRILILHSRYLSGEISGENRVVADEARLLRDGGHHVASWTPSAEASGLIGRLEAGVRSVWSTRATAIVDDMIRRERPDVVHCHNLFPELSPAILRSTARAPIAMVMTLHNFRALCLPATFVRDGRVCEDCLGREPWPGVVHACYRGSRAGSAALAASLSLHRTLRTFDRPDRYLAVSRFVREKYVEAGWSADRIGVRSNFAWPTERREGAGEYFLYLGRLSSEKGIPTILEAFAELSAPLLIVGDGPEAARLRAFGRSSSVEFRGAVPASEVGPLLRGARALLVPSVCYEGQPRGILEAYAAGVPVIASDLGGLPEVVEDGVDGLLVPPAAPLQWRDGVERLLDDAESDRLGEGAWRRWRECFTPQRGLVTLESQYERALDDVSA